MRLLRYLAALLTGFALYTAVWHGAAEGLGLTGAVAAAPGLIAALAAVYWFGLAPRARHLLVISLLVFALFALALVAQMPMLQPLAAHAFAAPAALVFGLIGFALYLRNP